MRDLLPAKIGLRRTLSAPITNINGEQIGTLCFLDGKCHEICGPEDVEFMTVMANRIATELERERSYLARTEDQRRSLERQAIELESTRQVLDAMNQSFELLTGDYSKTKLIERHLSLLSGILGFQAAGLFELSKSGAWGSIAHEGKVVRVDLNLRESVPLRAALSATSPDIRSEYGPSSKIAEQIGSDRYLIAKVPSEPAEWVLVLGGKSHSELPEIMVQTHLKAILEQTSLTLRVFELQEELRDAHQILSATQSRLVHVEKLSVVGALAASIAHDIRNILAAISLECSQSGPPDEIVRNLQKQTDRFKVLSHRLLGYVTPKVLAREKVDLLETFERATSLLHSHMRIAGVTFVQDFDPKLPMIVADSHRVEHLIVNLLLNAIQAMSTTGGRLELSAKLDGESIKVTIKDNGRGIPENQLDRIFDAFMSSRTDGFGLGLFSCKQIVDEHGWTIHVSSRPSAGTTFTILIPIFKP